MIDYLMNIYMYTNTHVTYILYDYGCKAGRAKRRNEVKQQQRIIGVIRIKSTHREIESLLERLAVVVRGI